jgi:hypothetical protein
MKWKHLSKCLKLTETSAATARRARRQCPVASYIAGISLNADMILRPSPDPALPTQSRQPWNWTDWSGRVLRTAWVGLLGDAGFRRQNGSRDEWWRRKGESERWGRHLRAERKEQKERIGHRRCEVDEDGQVWEKRRRLRWSGENVRLKKRELMGF